MEKLEARTKILTTAQNIVCEFEPKVIEQLRKVEKMLLPPDEAEEKEAEEKEAEDLFEKERRHVQLLMGCMPERPMISKSVVIDTTPVDGKLDAYAADANHWTPLT